MITFAAILAVIVILQFIFEFSVGMQTIFVYTNYLIIFVFVLEYCLKLYVDESRDSFVVNPVHILDLLIIALALVDLSGIGYVSFLPDQAQISPVLRLLRVFPRILPRVLLTFFLAGRTAERIKDQRTTNQESPSQLQIATMSLKGGTNLYLAKDTNRSLILDEMPIWIDFQNISENDFEIIENIAMIPHDLLENKLLRASFPRIDPQGDVLTLFLWDSQVRSDGIGNRNFNISTNNMLILFSEGKIITLSTGTSSLFNNISNKILRDHSDKSFRENEFTDRILYSLLQQKLIDYSESVQRIEQKTIEFEEIPVDKTSPKFLEETFHFKKEILRISSNLWHFEKALHQLIDQENIGLFKIDNRRDFEYLHAESAYLYEITQNIKESLISLIELHTNTVSYDLNKVMKVIAVITCLAIIPATIGGLLGVNLTEGNFPIKLIEIFFVIFALMLLGIYAFYKMDWLK